MTIEEARKGAEKAAKSSGTFIAIVHDPYSENDTPYEFCPQTAVGTLFRFGTVVEVVMP